VARILIIDDEPAITDLLETMLSQDGHVVVKALNGEEGVRLAAGAAFDLVIADILMPRKGGLESIADLRSLHPAVKIILMSGAGGGHNKAVVADLAGEFGADAFLAKPLRLNMLRQTVKACLGAG
jgi:DNA-binding response OmpR family regulator